MFTEPSKDKEGPAFPAARWKINCHASYSVYPVKETPSLPLQPP